MIDDPFRRLLPHLTSPLISLYGFLRLNPNSISLMSVLIAGLACFFCARGEPILSLCFWWLGRLFDGTDGIYARATNQTTHFGAYLDIVCDMGSYSIMILGFLILHPGLLMVWFAILFLYVLCITSALALGAIEQQLGVLKQDNRGLRLGAGLAEGGETGIAYSLFLLLPEYIRPLTMVWIIVLSITVIARTILAKRVLNRHHDGSVY